MTNLTRYEENNFEVYVDNTGDTFTSVTGYARLSGLNKSTVSRRLQGVASEDIKTAEVLTPGGIQGVALIPQKLVAKWLMTDNPEVALIMCEAGVKKFMQLSAGFNPQTEEKQRLLTSWKQSRFTLKDIEPAYQAWCRHNKFSGNHTTNYIYLLVCELRADGLRQLELIDGVPTIAANYIPTEEELNQITDIKMRLTKYSRAFADYKVAVETAMVDLNR